MKTKTKIAIACQGGGSHTAFTAGVLKKLLEEGVHEQYDLVGLSGTSGGAICATAGWYGLLKTANGSQEPPYKWLVDFWKANSANSLWEKWFNTCAITIMRLTHNGIIPAFSVSPYDTDWLTEFWESVSPRKDFLDFKQLLENHFNFKEIQMLVEPSSPRLFISAVDILSGKFKVFDSEVPGEIRAEALMASAGIPTLFKAVEIDGAAYWDGLFSQNPPVARFLYLDIERRPDEIWVILINPKDRDSVPKTVQDILDRRNELSGNLSLCQEIHFIRLINHWIKKGALKKELMKKVKPIRVRWIPMSEEVAERLDYSSKLERDWAFISGLMNEGENQAKKILKI